jgi:hypothetical protein
MEPKKVIKKFTEFSDRNYRSIFNNGGYEPTRSFRRVIELPMGDRLGLFFVDSERPVIQQTHIPHPWIGEEPIMGRNLIQPIQVIFRDGINTDETEFQDFIRDWLHNQIDISSRHKKTICIRTLDPTGVEVERWDLRGCFPTAVIYTTNNNDTQTLEMTLHYDYCTINC